MNTIQDIQTLQSKNKDLLTKLVKLIDDGRDLGLDIQETYLEKAKEALNNTDTKLKVALIGGFSEGKTSIVAAWLEKLSNDMKINTSESSDAVSVYNIDNDIEIIDTPGLFGFKEKNDNGNIQKYKDITKQYVSQAHIILYVLNPANPIKASHAEDLNWLFRELNLLPRSVFVLSKFDEEVDIEDEEDYRDRLEIKKESIIERLKQNIALSESEAKDLSIVAVSANPYQKGTTYWLEHKDEFRKLSRIDTLREEAIKKITHNGGKFALVEEAKKSIINDVICKFLPTIHELENILHEQKEEQQNGYNKQKKDLAKIDSHMIKAQESLKSFAERYFSGLLLQLSGTSITTFKSFYEREMGDDKGNKIFTRLNDEIARETKSINTELINLANNIDFEIERAKANDSKLAQHGIKIGTRLLQNSGIINNTLVLAGRDGLVSVAKTLGMDVALKFKPYGAIKLAANINKCLPYIGMALTIFLEMRDAKKRAEEEEKFNAMKNELAESLEQQQQEFLEFVTGDTFKNEFSKNSHTIKEDLKKIESQLNNVEQAETKLIEWKNTAKDLQSQIE
ncbi:labile enterotoxin output A [Helicobacter didelphidarum]|uniref:Labile enterotoxin output A n=1 Tax=Helicobacter didelphidarum TaxID=2040648 RepID=A0A3D8IM85_9HELI|nr:LeoA/HP0731 family dynamin-like GTPase [Helicobacter didelphidarum]RDU66387.1 labile enterotoxin output A [Helicobacter didelphidarum]